MPEFHFSAKKACIKLFLGITGKTMWGLYIIFRQSAQQMPQKFVFMPSPSLYTSSITLERASRNANIYTLIILGISILQFLTYKKRPFPHAETTVPPGGNDSFLKREQQFPQAGTTVSSSGNDSFPKRERQ
ncbi:hypothetical protein [uncultured Bacteroides sp.]|uniref:hypothetical protein n=1 Tax=uncultured Bacteroides sp. TaxID=162156 RepID=UPI0025FA3EEF|nr:hypothetical protein [uncultured Bacteroides sp.]